jgi:hypothetical protein
MNRIKALSTIFASILVSLALLRVGPDAAAANFALRTGTNAYFRTTADSAALTPAKTITMEAWIKPTGPGVIFNEVDAFNILNWDQSLAEVTAQGDVVIGMPGISGAVSIGRLTFGEWTHVALRHDATSGVLNGFLNGQKGPGFLAGTRTFPPNAAYMSFGRAARTTLGTGGWLSADFDEVRIWNIARSDSQIATNYQSKIATTATGLVQNFHLDDGAGTNTTPIDDAAGRADGVNVGAAWVPSGILFPDLPVIGPTTTARMEDGSVQLTTGVDPQGSITQFYFEYGPTTSYGNSTATNTLPAQYGEVSVTAIVTNLTLGTYNVRSVASNPAGRVFGPNVSFTLTNAAGMAADFPTANGYLRTDQPTRPFFTNAALTAEFWFEAQPGVLFNEVDTIDVSLWDYSFLEIKADGTLRAGMPGVPSIDVRLLEFGKWYHVAQRYDPANSTMDIFIDGALAGSSSGTRLLPWDVGRQVYFCIGRGGPKNLGTGAFFHGKADEVRIWRVALSNEKIAENRDLILSGKDANLFADWSLDVVFGDRSPDKSPRNNPAWFINGVQLQPSLAPIRVDQRPTGLTGTVQESTTDAVILNGTVISESTNSVAYFIWGQGELTNSTPIMNFGNGTNNIQATINGLQGGASYSVALVVSNSFGTTQGTPVNFVKLGWAGYALSLPLNSYLRTTNDQRPFFPDETITIELWLKPKKAGVVIAETDRVSPSFLDSSIVEILSSGSVIAGFPGVTAVVIGRVDLNVWNHIVVRYDRATQKMDGFVNGVKSTTSSSGDRVAGWEIGRQVTYTFGKATRDKIGTGEALNGEWDEIRLWNIARSDADILATFDKKLLGSESGMVAYYRFDDTAPLTDVSRHNNPAAVSGGSSLVVSSAPVEVEFTPIATAAGGNVTMQFIGVPGREMQLESTSDFQTWTPGPIAIVNSLGIATFSVGQDSAVKFFRSKQL